MTVAAPAPRPERPVWTTTVLRPAGRLDRGAARALRPVLVALALLPGLVIVDLTAAQPVSAEGWRVLSSAAAALDEVGGGLLVAGLRGPLALAVPSGIAVAPARLEVGAAPRRGGQGHG